MQGDSLSGLVSPHPDLLRHLEEGGTGGTDLSSPHIRCDAPTCTCDPFLLPILLPDLIHDALSYQVQLKFAEMAALFEAQMDKWIKRDEGDDEKEDEEEDAVDVLVGAVEHALNFGQGGWSTEGQWKEAERYMVEMKMKVKIRGIAVAVSCD